MKLTCTVTAHLRADKKRKDGTCPVTYFLRVGRHVLKIPSGKYLHPNDWDKNRKRPKTHTPHGKALDKHIRHQLDGFDTYLLETERAGKQITSTIAAAYFSEKSEITLFDFWEQQVDLMKRKGLAEATLKSYRSALSALKDFNRNLDFNDLSLKVIKEFDTFLIIKRKNSNNGKWPKHKCFKAMLKKAIEEEYIKINPYQNFRIETDKVQRQHLTIDEVKALQSFDIPSDQFLLNKVRDLFLFGCFTGLRYSDVINLSVEDVKLDNDRPRLEITVTKTKRNLTIPLLKDAASLISKYITESHGKNSKVFPQIANQVINRNLKDIMKLIGINKHISFHCSRHSFGVILVEANTSMVDIRDLMGHMDIKQTQIYARATESHLFKSMSHLETMFQ